jgi:hypothetical protein
MSKRQDTESKVQDCTLTKADIAAFTKAADRLVGRKAYADWRIISRVLKKASDLALNESGQNSRQSPVYKKAFSRIIADLPPIAPSESTTKQYRAALLHIEDNEPAFGEWYAEQQSRVGNPVDLWLAFRDRDADESTDTDAGTEAKERTFTQAQHAEAQSDLNHVDKIAELMDRNAELERGDPSATPEGRLRQAWGLQTALTMAPANDVFVALLNQLIPIAIENGAYAPGIQKLIELAFQDSGELQRSVYTRLKEVGGHR